MQQMLNVSSQYGGKIPSQFKPPSTLEEVNTRLAEIEDWKSFMTDPRTTLQRTVNYRDILIKRDENYGHWKIYDQHHQIIPEIDGTYTSIVVAKQAVDRYVELKEKRNVETKC